MGSFWVTHWGINGLNEFDVFDWIGLNWTDGDERCQTINDKGKSLIQLNCPLDQKRIKGSFGCLALQLNEGKYNKSLFKLGRQTNSMNSRQTNGNKSKRKQILGQKKIIIFYKSLPSFQLFCGNHKIKQRKWTKKWSYQLE